jgi:DNA-binding transcriptional MerR regulator
MTSLDPHREQELTLAQLVSASTALIRATGVTPDDGRTSVVPDARTVRYYQTLGLIPKPLRYEGRSAVYGYEHLVRVVAVKLLQAKGFSLARVQEAFAGLTLAQLEAAVAEALGQPAPSRPPAARGLVAAEVAPGVQVTLDPSRVSDPDEVLRRIAALFAHSTH